MGWDLRLEVRSKGQGSQRGLMAQNARRSENGVAWGLRGGVTWSKRVACPVAGRFPSASAPSRPGAAPEGTMDEGVSEPNLEWQLPLRPASQIPPYLVEQKLILQFLHVGNFLTQ